MECSSVIFNCVLILFIPSPLMQCRFIPEMQGASFQFLPHQQFKCVCQDEIKFGFDGEYNYIQE